MTADLDLARAILAKIDRDRRATTTLQADVLEVDDDDDNPIPIARVHIDGNPPGVINAVPIATPVRLRPGQRVLVHFAPPGGAYIIGVITRATGGTRPYAERVVAAYNSVATDAVNADFVCPGDTTDADVIAAALDSLTLDGERAPGRVLLLAGDYLIAPGILNVYGDPTVASDGIIHTLAGQGPSTRLIVTGQPDSVGVSVSGGVLEQLSVLADDFYGTLVNAALAATVRNVYLGFPAGGDA